MNISDARRIAEDYMLVNMSSDGDVSKYALYAKVEEDEGGWYFFYNTRKYIETDNINYSSVGNWPLFVSKEGVCTGGRVPPSMRFDDEE